MAAATATAEAPRSTDVTLVFVGTGVSTAVPVIGHVGAERTCACVDAIRNPNGPNRRNNVSLLVQLPSPTSDAGGEPGPVRNFLVDCGKTFRDAYFRTLAPRGVVTLDAVLITHDHQDALAGVDDLRDLQRINEDGKHWVCPTPLSVFLSGPTLSQVRRAWPYLLDRASHAPSAHEQDLSPPRDVTMERRAACLRFHEVDDQAVRPLHVPCFDALGIPCVALPVFHGGTYRCLGMAFGRGLLPRAAAAAPGTAAANGAADPATETAASAPPQTFVYLSDISSFPDDVLAYLKALPNGIDVLVIDMLFWKPEGHFAHLSVPQAFKAIVEELHPRVAYGTGMYCDVVHDHGTQWLAEELGKHKAANPGSRVERIELAHDGLELTLPL